MDGPIPWEKVVKALNRLRLPPETVITEAIIEEALRQLDKIEHQTTDNVKTIYDN